MRKKKVMVLASSALILAMLLGCCGVSERQETQLNGKTEIKKITVFR